jgi:hypothetical protein
MTARALSRRAPLALVALAVGFGLVELWPETRPVAYLNDSAFHTEMVRFAAQRISAGHDPLTSWFSPINLGSPVYLHYQSLPSIITALFALAFGTQHAYGWSIYLLLATWPVPVYAGGRLFGLPRWGAAAAAALAPLMASTPGVGYQWGSYLWIGWGVWTQLWAMWVMPLAWGFSWQAISRRRHIAAAIFCDALVVCLHYLSGYMMALPLVVLPFIVIGRREFWHWLGRAAAVAAGGLLLSSWVVFPVFLERAWAARNEFLAGTTNVNSFGAQRILSWFADGQLFDPKRLPVMTVLVVVGLVVCLLRFASDLRARALVVLFVVALVAFFGRPTLGPLLDLVPGAADLFLRRFLAGVQLAGLLLAGVGALTIGRCALALVERAVALARQARGVRLVPAGGGEAARLVIAALGVLALYPAWSQLAAYARSEAADVSYQVRADDTTGAQVDKLLAVVRARAGGRVFAGEIDTTLGQSSRIGLVPLYTWLADQEIDAVGFTLRSASLMSNPEQSFVDTNPADYDLFAVRWMLLPAGTQPLVRAELVATAGGFTLWSLARTQPGSGYLQVVDTQGTIAENRTDIGAQSQGLLQSGLAAEGIYPTVAWDGAPGPAGTLATGTRPSGPAGSVLSSDVRLADGAASATVVANRRAVVLLKVSFDPGWRVEVDGRPARTEMVAPALVGVEVGRGRHVVSFTYVGYGGYPFFFALSAAVLVALVALPRAARRAGRARLWPGPLSGAGCG